MFSFLFLHPCFHYFWVDGRPTGHSARSSPAVDTCVFAFLTSLYGMSRWVGGKVFDRFCFCSRGNRHRQQQLHFSLGTPPFFHQKTFWQYGTKHTTLRHSTRLASFVVSVTEDAETATNELAVSLALTLQPQFAPPNFDNAALIHLAPVPRKSRRPARARTTRQWLTGSKARCPLRISGIENYVPSAGPRQKQHTKPSFSHSHAHFGPRTSTPQDHQGSLPRFKLTEAWG